MSLFSFKIDWYWIVVSSSTTTNCAVRKEWSKPKTHFRTFLLRTQPNSHTVNVYCCRFLLTMRHSACHVQRLSVQHIYLTNPVKNVQSTTSLYLHNYTEPAATYLVAQDHSIFTVQTRYKLYSLQLNCNYSNYTQTAATCSAAKQHSTFTVKILYKLYSLQLTCSYSNSPQAAATCSAAPQHSTFTVQILYKLYSLQLNCTYSNYTEAAAAACSAAQQNKTPKVMSSEVEFSRLFGIVYIYMRSRIKIISLKEMQLTAIALPQPHSATQHSLIFLSGDCKAAYIFYASFLLLWRNSGMLFDLAWWVEQEEKHFLIPSVWYNTTAANACFYYLFTVSPVTVPFQLQ